MRERARRGDERGGAWRDRGEWLERAEIEIGRRVLESEMTESGGGGDRDGEWRRLRSRRGERRDSEMRLRERCRREMKLEIQKVD